jgi:hypothetical protein
MHYGARPKLRILPPSAGAKNRPGTAIFRCLQAMNLFLNYAFAMFPEVSSLPASRTTLPKYAI